MGEIIHEGWLVKSPPDKKNQTLPRFFQAKWRRRYFVLHAPPASDRLPGSSNCVLDYFKDQTKSKKKGSIDLDQCEEITSALDSAHYQHLFALRSKHKGQDRTYYLAADSEHDMTKWVECLCNVCGCKPVPDHDDLPPGPGGTQPEGTDWPMLQAPTPQGTPNRYYEGTPTRTQTVRNQPTSQMTAVPRPSPSTRSAGHARSPASRHRSPAARGGGLTGNVGNGSAAPVRQASTEEYFPIWDSETGDNKGGKGIGTSPLDKVPPAPSRTARHDSVDSIPDMDAPPPPIKVGSTPGGRTTGIQGDYDPDQTYDHPSKCYNPVQYVNMDALDSSPRAASNARELYQVPPPRAHQRPNVDDGVYKVPPARYTHQTQAGGSRGTNAIDSFYQVPPPAKGTSVRQSHDMFYDVPPSRPSRDQAQRNSNSSNESRSSQKGSDSAYGSEDFYDHPPLQRAPDPPGAGSGAAGGVTHITRHLRTTEIRSTTTTAATSVISQCDVYDVPPPRKTHSEENMLGQVPPPPKPPKGGGSSVVLPEEQGPYLNLPPNSKAHPGAGRSRAAASVLAAPKRTTVSMDDMYDFPPSQASKDRAMLSLSPPPPHPCVSTQHGYVNAPPGFLPNATNHNHNQQHHTDSVYMPMDLGPSAGESSDHLVIQDDIYLPMGERVSTGSAIYTDMTATAPCPAAPPAIGRSYSAAAGTHPPRLQRITPQNSQDQPTEGFPIHVFSSQRTRSFKRDPSIRADVHVPLPMRRPGAAAEDSSSSEDEDSDSASSHDKSLDNIVHRQSAPLTLQEKLIEKKSLNSTPPAPQRAGEVQYLDLDLEEAPDETERSPVFARSPPAPGSASPTDYKEIDFIKTKALSDVRKDLDTKRKSSEKSLDD